MLSCFGYTRDYLHQLSHRFQLEKTFSLLRQQVHESSTRPFRVRGSVVKRCLSCLMADFACFCAWKREQPIGLEFIVLVHRNEVFKPTNSGRLIGDLFPRNTAVFLWSRTEPDPALLELLNESSRRTLVLFPDNRSTARLSPSKTYVETDSHLSEERIAETTRVVLLDGTWKQASKMANQSAWLQAYPRVALQESAINAVMHAEGEIEEQSFIRKAQHKYQLSTAQAAACLLHEYGEVEPARYLADYFSVFNQHCVATRRNIAPHISSSHLRLKP